MTRYHHSPSTKFWILGLFQLSHNRQKGNCWRELGFDDGSSPSLSSIENHPDQCNGWAPENHWKPLTAIWLIPPKTINGECKNINIPLQGKIDNCQILKKFYDSMQSNKKSIARDCLHSFMMEGGDMGCPVPTKSDENRWCVKLPTITHNKITANKILLEAETETPLINTLYW